MFISWPEKGKTETLQDYYWIVYFSLKILSNILYIPFHLCLLIRLLLEISNAAL